MIKFQYTSTESGCTFDTLEQAVLSDVKTSGKIANPKLTWEEGMELIRGISKELADTIATAVSSHEVAIEKLVNELINN